MQKFKKTTSLKLITNDARQSREIMFSQKPEEPIRPKNFNRTHEFNIIYWSPIEFARQLTFLESKLFKRIEPNECLSGAWAKDKKYEVTPNIVALTDRWNIMTDYVSLCVLRETELKRRKKNNRKIH